MTAVKLRPDALIPRAERLREHVAPRMIAGLALVELPCAAKPADVRVVLGDLPHAAVARQVVNPGVADVADIPRPATYHTRLSVAPMLRPSS